MDEDVKAIVETIKPELVTDRFKYDDEAIGDVVKIIRGTLAGLGISGRLSRVDPEAITR